MTAIITQDHFRKSQNTDKNGNPFTVFYITSSDCNIYTAYENTEGIKYLDTNMFLKLHYNENTVNGKTYKNCYRIEPVTSMTEQETKKVIEKVEEETKDVLDKRVSELTKEEEVKVLKIILATLLKGITEINKTLGNCKTSIEEVTKQNLKNVTVENKDKVENLPF